MQTPLDLVAIFLERACSHAQFNEVSFRTKTPFERLLCHAWETGREQWPHLPLAADVFVRHLGDIFVRCLAGQPPAPSGRELIADAQRFLEKRYHADLYLACACTQQLPAAILAFEQQYFIHLRPVLRRRRLSYSNMEDVCQQLRIHVLVRTPEHPPKIANYSGRGTLHSWLQIVATRATLGTLRNAKDGAEDSLSSVDRFLPAPGADPELDLLQRTYHQEFRQALTEAFATLSRQERKLLRSYFIDKMPTPAIGLLYQVNQSTASRWIANARQRVHEETKALLQRRLRLSPGELESFVRHLKSQIDITLSRILRDDEDKSQER